VAFSNRTQIVYPQAPPTNYTLQSGILACSELALPVGTVGGNLEVDVSLAAGTFTGVLGSLAGTTKAWRLHSFCSPDLGGITGTGLLFTGTGVFFGVISAGLPTVVLDGRLTQTAVSILNNSGISLRFSLAYDLVDNPYIV